MNIRRIAWLAGSQLLMLSTVDWLQELPTLLIKLAALEGSWLIAWGTYSFKDEPLGK